MTDTDRPAFYRLLIGIGELYDKTLSTAAQVLYWDALKGYALDDLHAAFKAHVTTPDAGRFMPRPADLIARLPHQPPGPEEAWALAVQAKLWDEAATVVIAQAIFAAFPFALWPDQVAARMAFKEAYPEALREHGEALFVSLGHDVKGRAPVIAEAVQRGLITAERARQLLPNIDARLLSRDAVTALAAKAEDRARLTHGETLEGECETRTAGEPEAA